MFIRLSIQCAHCSYGRDLFGCGQFSAVAESGRRASGEHSASRIFQTYPAVENAVGTLIDGDVTLELEWAVVTVFKSYAMASGVVTQQLLHDVFSGENLSKERCRRLVRVHRRRWRLGAVSDPRAVHKIRHLRWIVTVTQSAQFMTAQAYPGSSNGWYQRFSNCAWWCVDVVTQQVALILFYQNKIFSGTALAIVCLTGVSATGPPCLPIRAQWHKSAISGRICHCKRSRHNL